ncbi:MAG TPA: hypothetical protein VFJ43_08540, partial [Bacteroidia bacterium]|nr:hypothetical protein [Bacteroidia bacterium]
MTSIIFANINERFAFNEPVLQQRYFGQTGASCKDLIWKVMLTEQGSRFINGLTNNCNFLKWKNKMQLKHHPVGLARPVSD